MPEAGPTKADTLPFDELLERLKKVVHHLESGNLPLEDSLKAYEEGVGLARMGHELLDRAERRVEILARGAQGEPVAEPFDDSQE